MSDPLAAAIHLRRDLTTLIPAPVWPPGLRPGTFSDAHAVSVHALLSAAYAGGEGDIASFHTWRDELLADPNFDPALCLAAFDEAGRVAAVAQCWTTGFIKDLAVDPAFRRRGLARALLRHVFFSFRARGASHVDLRAKAFNAPALALYLSEGMEEVLK
ncbi:GNAT family N-acetyltransferase [bacterium]|nr:GNAT family N-acetyltransferase [bacterium]